MGCRGQVKIKDDCGGSVFLYTHWRADCLKEDVALALARGKRWNDCEYLARIIFDQMKGNDFGSTGFGIGASEQRGIEELIVIDPKNQEISWFEDFGCDENSHWVSSDLKYCSFEEYVEKHKAFIDECIAKNELFIKEN